MAAWLDRLSGADGCNVGSAIFALSAAAFWFVSAYGEMPMPQSYYDYTPKSDPFTKALKFGARMNRWAAGSAGVSALFAVAANVAAIATRP